MMMVVDVQTEIVKQKQKKEKKSTAPKSVTLTYTAADL